MPGDAIGKGLLLDSPVIGKPLFQKAYPYRYFLISLLCVFFMGVGDGGFLVIVVGYLENQNLVVSLIGFIMAFLSIVEGIFNLLTGFLYRGVNEKRYIQYGALILASGIFMFALQPAGAAIWLAIALNAAGTGVLTVMIYTTAQMHLPKTTQTGMAVGLYTAAIAVGMSIGSPLVGFLTDTFGYPTAFLVCGFIVTGISITAALLPSRGEISSKPLPGLPAFQQFKESFSFRNLSHPGVITGLGTAFAMAGSISLFSTYFPLYGLQAGLSYTRIGSMMGLQNVFAGFIRPLCGFFISGGRSGIINLIGLVVLSLAIIFLPFVGLSWPLLVIVSLVGLSFGVSRVTSMTLVIEGEQMPSDISKQLSLYNALMTIGHIIAPGLGGLVAGQIGLSLTLTIVPAGFFVVFLLARLLGARSYQSISRDKRSDVPAARTS
jgi:MFS family permease